MSSHPRIQLQLRLGTIPDRQLARDVGVSYETIRQARIKAGIPRMLAPGLSPARKLVLDVLVPESLTLAEIAKRAYGVEDTRARGLARQVLSWLMKNAHAEHVRRGEYRKAAKPKEEA